MTISVGDRIPEADLFVPSDSGPQKISTGDIFSGRKVVLVGMPGAFTPTCHRSHLPGFLENRDAILAKGVDEIVVLATNDAWVMGAWADAAGAAGRIRFVSDGNADFVKKAGLDMDGSARGLGTRAKRFALIADNGVVTSIAIEEQAGQAIASAAAKILEQLP
jgi:peroxiredoxin